MCSHSGAQARQLEGLPQKCWPCPPACKSSCASHGEFRRLGPCTLQNAGIGEGLVRTWMLFILEGRAKGRPLKPIVTFPDFTSSATTLLEM